MGKKTLNRTTLVDNDVRAVARSRPKAQYCLVRVFGPSIGPGFELVPITADGIIFGRNPPKSNGMALEDHKSSRKHAHVKPIPGTGRIAVCDLRSTNGTYLNGTAITRQFLSVGDVLRIGHSLFVFAASPPSQEPGDHDVLVGRSKGLVDAVNSLRQVAPTDLKVLIMGETGTGKELAAQTLHQASGRRGPFVPVNCGSFPASLIESELFGYVKGAFSGADRAKEGLIASANHGTLFLDEIGELPLALQPRLLRVLQNQEVRPVGATTSKRVDVRVIAATNQNVHSMVESDRFRRDLLARLEEWPVQLPPLRNRKEDLGLLLAHFLEVRDVGDYAQTFDPDILELMLLHDWPGNVRELAAAVARVAVSVQNQQTEFEVLRRQVFGSNPPQVGDSQPVPPPPQREELAAIVALFEGNISGVSRYYGKERQQVYRWLERFDLKQ